MPVSQPNLNLRLAKHVRACRVGDQLIFLDLLRSKYCGIGGSQVPALSEAILGSGITRGAQTQTYEPRMLQAGVRRLCDQHLLSTSPSTAHVPPSTSLAEPIAGLTMDDEDLALDYEWRDIAHMWRATIVAASWLRRRTLADIVDRVADLRSAVPGAVDALPTTPMRHAAAQYVRLRPFALTSHDRCLHDSLTLIQFLAMRSFFPRWVIGVRIRPFGAHSWVQSGGLVLNDLPESVRHYQPILVV